MTCYRSLPLRHVSRAWGGLHEAVLPGWLVRPLLSLYCSAFGCDLSEAEWPDLAQYPNLGALFRRRLRPGCRPVDTDCSMVSHCNRSTACL